MANKRFMKFVGRCQITKVIKKGKTPKIFMKCLGNKKSKRMSAQEILDSS